jgi:hypothetical protein
MRTARKALRNLTRIRLQEMAGPASQSHLTSIDEMQGKNLHGFTLSPSGGQVFYAPG